jgi:PAS domain S-box-containing protein
VPVHWDLAEVVDAGHGAVAADDTNRILAVSRPLAQALGWTVDDLVGRRLVALVPPELREAHVAGFSRHVTTGERHILDVPVQLPVLRADGSRVLCDVLISHRSSATGRHLYVASVEPVT